MNFVVTFTRNITEIATIITEAGTKAQAIENARAILTNADYDRDEVSEIDVFARPLRSQI